MPIENAAWIGLVRYQLLSAKPHPITSAIARMHPDDQDAIDDFCHHTAVTYQRNPACRLAV